MNKPILTEEGYNMNEVALMDKNKELLELLKEARTCIANHRLISDSICYLCGDIVSDDCADSHQFELAKKIDSVIKEHKKETNK